jgi:hypothetical protein
MAKIGKHHPPISCLTKIDSHLLQVSEASTDLPLLNKKNSWSISLTAFAALFQSLVQL